jgi:phage internal scaffolding protein
MSFLPTNQTTIIDKKTKRRRVVTVNNDTSMTEQSHLESTDLNKIMKKLQQGVAGDFFNKNEGKYSDVTAVDYHDAMNKIAATNSMFEELPSNFRNKFENNPEVFLDFVQNPVNQDELISMGLATDNRPQSEVVKSEPTQPEPAV